jgi:hypothetical protein
MNMWASANSFTHDDLRKAFNDYAKAHGHGLATLALESSTGAWDISAVPEDRILTAMVEFVAGYSFVGKAAPRPTPAGGLTAIHSRLDTIRTDALQRTAKVR